MPNRPSTPNAIVGGRCGLGRREISRHVFSLNGRVDTEVHVKMLRTHEITVRDSAVNT